jgi:site-specific recombinase XerD
VLAIPSKRFTRTLVQFLTRAEVDALLATPDQRTWFGRRDHAFLLVAVQTGLRVSEMTGLTREDVVLGTGAHVRVIGKGRKERCTPLARSTRLVVKAWLHEPQRGNGNLLFPSAMGKRLTVHGVQYLLNKHRMAASKVCPSLKHKRVTVHRLRHTMAMDLLQADVDRSVIALWLGHESVETTQIYLEATLAMKEQALAKTTPPNGSAARYHPGDRCRSVGTEFKVMQELLRHSSLRSTLDVYTQAISPAKHAAQAAVLALVFTAETNTTESSVNAAS